MVRVPVHLFSKQNLFWYIFFSQKFYNYRVLSIIGKFSIKIYCQVPPYPTLYGTGRELNIFLVQYSYLHYTYINNIGRYTLFCSVPVSSVFPNCWTQNFTMEKWLNFLISNCTKLVWEYIESKPVAMPLRPFALLKLNSNGKFFLKDSLQIKFEYWINAS